MSDRLTLREGVLDDWYVIERAEHDVKPYCYNDRHCITDTPPPHKHASLCGECMAHEAHAFEVTEFREALERVTKERDEARRELQALKDSDLRCVHGVQSCDPCLDGFSQRERAALAACAEMRAALEAWGVVRWTDADEYGRPPQPKKQHRCRECDGITTADRPVRHRKTCAVGRALASDAGRGWVSPKEHAKVVERAARAETKLGETLVERQNWVSPEAFDAALREVADAAVRAGSPKNSSRCADGGHCDHYECREDRMFAVTNRRRAIDDIIAAAKAKYGGGR